MMMEESIEGRKILIVDDQERNVKLLRVLCRSLGHETIEAANGQEAVEAALAHQPDTILMDVMMPVMDGFAATEQLKGMEETKHIPVIMVTALESREDRLNAISKGADDFLTKPIDLDELKLRLNNNLRTKGFHDFLAHHNKILEEKVEERTRQLSEGYIDTIQRLTLACEYRDDETGAHIRRISFYTKELAGKIGLGSEVENSIFYASPMHDIGKVGIPDRVLLKEGPLDNAEWAIMKTHPSIGGRVLEGSASPFLQMAVEIANCHHERWDGGGYPRGIKGEEIPMAARVMNIADQYDALRSRRPYKPAFDHAKTYQIITVGDGRTMPEHFDPVVLQAFKEHADVFADIFDSYEDADVVK